MQCWCENRWKTATKGPNVNIEYPLFFSLWKSSFHKHDALLGNFFQQRVFLLSFFFFFFPRVIYSTQLKCYILFYDIITEILIFEWRRKIWSTNSRIHYLFLYYLLYNTMWSSRRENYWLIIRVRSKENIFFNWNILRGYAGNLLMIIRILITTIIIACDRN